MQPTEKVLMDKGDSYGFFMRQARVSQALKKVLRTDTNFITIYSDRAEALELITTELSKILCCNSDEIAFWRCIEELAKLVADRMQEDQELQHAKPGPIQSVLQSGPV